MDCFDASNVSSDVRCCDLLLPASMMNSSSIDGWLVQKNNKRPEAEKSSWCFFLMDRVNLSEPMIPLLKSPSPLSLILLAVAVKPCQAKGCADAVFF